jgi:hypothetical protein
VDLLKAKGFVNPDDNGEESSKEVFSYKEISMLIDYLKYYIEGKDKPYYRELVQLLENNLEYADVDQKAIKNTNEDIQGIGHEVVITFMAYILTVAFYTRYWTVNGNYEIPYLKHDYNVNELNEDLKAQRDGNVQQFMVERLEPWLNSLDRNVRDVLINFKNIKQNNSPPPKYVVDKRSDTSFDEFNITRSEFETGEASGEGSGSVGSSESCRRIKSVPEGMKKRNIPKNTLYGRIYHGIYGRGACFGVNGDLLIDNVMIYNELFLHYEDLDYNAMITEEVKSITGVHFETIVLGDIEFTHGSTKRRAAGLEDNY